MEHRLRDVARRDADLLAGIHVGDAALVDRVGHGPLELGLVTLQEALAVDRTLVLAVQTPVDEV